MEKASLQENAREDQNSLFRVGVRVPPFWPEKPELWFAQIEGQFILSNISADVTKFYYVIGQLDHIYASEVEDVITKPPETGKYDKLKEQLIKRLSESKEKKIKQLLLHEELGSRKPSQFFRHLKSLAGPTVPDDFIRTLWSSRLPTNIQTIVASQNNTPLETVVDLADKVYDIAPSAPQAASLETSNRNMDIVASVESTNRNLDSMARSIAELTSQVATLFDEVRSRPMEQRSRRAPQRSYTPRSSKSRSRSSNNNKFCWFHYKFGHTARKCIQPCSFTSENPYGSRK